MLKAAIAQRKEAKEWDYSRQPLDKQLDQGVRSFELDLHLSDKGWQILHVPIFDPGTTVPTFTDALRVIRKWSDAHPRHVPISILLELKEEGFQLSRSFRRPQASDLAMLDKEIRDVFSPERILTPDDVRGRHKTLWEAIHAEGWPTLNEAAGKVILILHEKGPNREAYLDGHPSLEGRAMFVESDLGQPHSAVLIRNNPTDPEIDALAREGYLIRTRVDSQGDLRTARRERALASGGAYPDDRLSVRRNRDGAGLRSARSRAGASQSGDGARQSTRHSRWRADSLGSMSQAPPTRRRLLGCHRARTAQ